MIINPYNVTETNASSNQECNALDVAKEESICETVEKIAKELILNCRELIEERQKNVLEDKINEIVLRDYNESATKPLIVTEVLNKIFGYGILQKYIEKEEITDIRVVKYNEIYVKEKGSWYLSGEGFESEKHLEEYIRFCALKNNSGINYECPINIFSDRKNGLRIEAGISPANISSPNIVIRIHKKDNKLSLKQLMDKHNMLNEKEYNVLIQCIREKKNIVICGCGGSGKTTLLRALIDLVPQTVAITTNEETAELYLDGRNVIQRECILNRKKDKNIDLEELVRHSLVMSNDMIIIGELKGAEANMFFDAISTGHIGFATLHADSAINMIDRLITLIKKDVKAMQYTETFLKRFLASSIDVIIYMSNFKIVEIVKANYDEEKSRLTISDISKNIRRKKNG